MSIEKNLADIMNAVKGKDVRQSIHDGIRQCYIDNDETLKQVNAAASAAGQQAQQAQEAAASAGQKAAEAAGSAAAAEESARRIEESAAQKARRVYCWGDSLTQGEGSNLKLTDGVFSAYNLHPYTRELTGFLAVNLGCQGENITTIMARQGADPMTVGGVTIPAEAVPVAVGNKKDGIVTVSGGRARPLCPMDAGINPCTVAGVRGILHRGATRDDSDDNYYFTRLAPGKAVDVPAGTVVETFAMRHYRGGEAVIWMGANGGHSGAADFVEKVRKMVTYGKYTNYLVLISREFGAADIASISAALTDKTGCCHVLNLYQLLPRCGLALANMTHYYFDTSAYANGDEILLRAPVLCECSQVNGNPQFGALHFSAYGYRAIGKLVAAWLTEMETGAENSEEAIGETNVTDSHGLILWKLKEPYTSDGTKAINTKWRPYDRAKNWTVVCKIKDGFGGPGVFNSVFEARDDGAGIETTLHLRVEMLTEEPVFNIGIGSRAGFSVLKSGGLFEWVGGDFSTDGSHYCVISNNGGNYVIAFDGGCWDGYGAPLSGGFSSVPLMLFARQDNTGVPSQYATGTIEDFRIYDSAFTAAQCKAIIEEMKGE